MTPSPPSAKANKLEIDDWVQRVEDATAQFVGSEFCAARLIAYISAQAEMGYLAHDQAGQLLDDAYHLQALARLGHQAHKWLRRPPVPLEMMVLRNARRVAA